MVLRTEPINRSTKMIVDLTKTISDVFVASKTGFCLVGKDTKILHVNHGFAAFMATQQKKLIGKEWISIFHTEDSAKVFEQYSLMLKNGTAEVECRFGQSVGLDTWARIEMLKVSPEIWLMLGFDIGAFKENESALNKMAFFDSLTQVYNRRGFLRVASEHIDYIRRTRKAARLIFVDVDRLKPINDVYGHEAGDKALKMVATILKTTFRSSDVIARVGGDEFCLLAHDCNMSVFAIRKRLHTVRKRFNRASGKAWEVDFSIGSVRVPLSRKNVSIGDLVSLADRQMYNRKRAKKASR
jgi:diguanylate cyclase (GGDEF)-like protein